LAGRLAPWLFVVGLILFMVTGIFGWLLVGVTRAEIQHMAVDQ
jgi:uncharacterized membrane protein